MHKYIYCSVKFDTEKSYYYRTDERGYHVGSKVIVPVGGNGLWQVGEITQIEKFTFDSVPYPLDKTKGIISKAGILGERKVQKHNNMIEKSEYPPMDISIKSIKTEHGRVSVITTLKERERMASFGEKFVLIENFPPATSEQVKNRPKEI